MTASQVADVEPWTGAEEVWRNIVVSSGVARGEEDRDSIVTFEQRGPQHHSIADRYAGFVVDRAGYVGDMYMQCINVCKVCNVCNVCREEYVAMVHRIWCGWTWMGRM